MSNNTTSSSFESYFEANPNTSKDPKATPPRTTSTGVRPEDQLPNLQVLVKNTRLHFCEAGGAKTRYYTGSFIVPKGTLDSDIQVILPEHRRFWQATSYGCEDIGGRSICVTEWTTVTDKVSLPRVCSHSLNTQINGKQITAVTPIAIGSIVEIDMHHISKTSKYRRYRDIKLSEGNYFYVNDLCIFRGASVLSIGSNLSQRDTLYKIHDLPPRYRSLQQAYFALDKETPSPFKGTMVLQTAAYKSRNTRYRYRNHAK